MPTFTDEKRERVREALRDTGRERFGRYGIRKTSVSELTEAVGTGKGTFYQFYDSNEELYVDILSQYREEAVPRLLNDTFEVHDDLEDAIRAFLKQGMNKIESDSVIQQIIAENTIDMLQESHLEELEVGHEHDIAYIFPYIEAWYAAGRVTGPDPETIVDVLDAVAYLMLHIEDIGEDRYPAVRNTIIAAVAAELTRDSDETAPTEDDHE